MIALALIAAQALAAGTPPLVGFPGPRTSVQSPTSSARVYYLEMGTDQGGQNLSLRFDPGNGRPIILKRFDRGVDIGWSPSGALFLVNDYIGSDIADCLIVRPQASGVHGISLSRVVARAPGRPRETPANSHYYVHCNRWLSDRIVDGVIEGHTDEPARGAFHPYGFEYGFKYDVATGRLRWHGRQTWDPNR